MSRFHLQMQNQFLPIMKEECDQIPVYSFMGVRRARQILEYMQRVCHVKSQELAGHWSLVRRCSWCAVSCSNLSHHPATSPPPPTHRQCLAPGEIFTNFSSLLNSTLHVTSLLSQTPRISYAINAILLSLHLFIVLSQKTYLRHQLFE